MTRAEYEAKYGQTPNAAPTSTQPVQMTRAEYQSKYGGAIPTPQTPSGYKQGSVVQDFAKDVVDPLTKAGTSMLKTVLPKALEPKYAQGSSVPSVFGGRDVDLVGYRDGQKLQGKELAKDIGGTALEVASYAPIARGAAIVQKGIGGAAAKVGQLAKEFGVAGALQGAGSSYQQGGTTGEAISQGLTTGAISTVAGPVIGKGAELAGKAGSNIVKKITDPVKYYTDSAKTNALKAVNVIGGVKPADMSKIKDKAYRALSVIKKVNPEIKRGEIDVPLDIKNSDTPYLDVNDALVQTRKRVYEGIRDAYKEATGQGLTINPGVLLEDLRGIYNNPANAIEKRTKAQAIRDELLGMTDKDGNIPIENIETYTPQLNERARPGFGASSALGAKMDKDFAIKLSDFVDDAVEKIGIPQLRTLKDDYSSLKAIEKYILNEAKKEARRLDTSLAANVGDVGSAEILSGMVNAFRATTGDPQAAASLAKGVALKAFSKMRQAAGDRANYLRKAFDDIDEINKQTPRAVTPELPIEPKKKVDSPSILETLKKSVRSPRGFVDLNAEIFPKKPAASVYKETGDLTTKILKSLEGKSTVSKQFILDATNRGELKQVERDLVRRILDENYPTSKTGDYKMSHRPTEGVRAFDLTEKVDGEQMIPKDMYEQWYGSRGTQSDKESIAVLKKIRGNPDAEVTIYRASPENSFNDGDWVTFSKSYATEHAEGNGSKVHSKVVKAKDVRWAMDDVNEFGYYPAVKKASDTVNVQEFANKVKAELLPLNTKSSSLNKKDLSPAELQKMDARTQTKYENITLPDELRGKVKDYKENIYESPIKTSAGSTHFSGQTDSYFGHTRIEDMADNSTRRVIEVQSDLYQKGNLDREEFVKAENFLNALSVDEKKFMTELANDPKRTFWNDLPRELFAKMRPYGLSDGTVFQLAKDGFPSKAAGITKLAQYNDPTAHFRMIREEIKKAAQDGKTKLQFPTGETAMKIEGLGDNRRWYNLIDSEKTVDRGDSLTPENLKVGSLVGQESAGSDMWVITDVLGDGKFKAVPKNKTYLPSETTLPESKQTKLPDGRVYNNQNEFIETFDISGKVDTNNPIYKFYNKEVRNYLNKFGGKEVKDDKGVSWIEIPIGKNSKGAVEAFGLLGAVGLGTAASGNKSASAMSTQEMPLLGNMPEDNQEAFMKPDELYLRKPVSTYSVRKNLSVSEDELKELAAVLFGEVGNRPLSKKLTELRAITNVALNRAEKEGKTLKEVLQSPNQFQAYLGKQYNAYKSGKASNSILEKEKIKAVEAVIDEIRKGKLKNTVGDNLSYAHLKDDTLRLYKNWSEQKKDLNNIK